MNNSKPKPPFIFYAAPSAQPSKEVKKLIEEGEKLIEQSHNSSTAKQSSPPLASERLSASELKKLSSHFHLLADLFYQVSEGLPIKEEDCPWLRFPTTYLTGTSPDFQKIHSALVNTAKGLIEMTKANEAKASQRGPIDPVA